MDVFLRDPTEHGREAFLPLLPAGRTSYMTNHGTKFVQYDEGLLW